MYRVIKVDDKEIPMEGNAMTPIRYRMLFKKNIDDFFTGVLPYKSETLAELAYVMKASAAKEDMNKLSYEGFVDWASEFTGTAFLMASQEIIDLYMGNVATEIEAKKNNDLLSEA